MNKPRRLALLALAGLTASAAGAGAWYVVRSRQVVRPSLLIAGSAAMLELNRAWAASLAKKFPSIDFVVEQGGSLPGLIALQRGAIDIAAMSRELNDEEDTALTRSYLVAKNQIAIAVHPQAGIKNMSKKQVIDVFTGVITNWADLGGPNAPIRLVTRRHNTGTLRFMQEIVLDGADVSLSAREADSAYEVGRIVSQDKLAMGFIALKDRDTTPLTYLNIDGVAPTTATALSGRYPFTQPLYLVLHGSPSHEAQAYVDFARSPEGQKIVLSRHLIPVV